jgi:hypothetical protein
MISDKPVQKVSKKTGPASWMASILLNEINGSNIAAGSKPQAYEHYCHSPNE